MVGVIRERRPYGSRKPSASREHPRNAGEVENADASVQLENPVCGDVLKLTVKIEQGRITAIRFRAKGCVPSMACGSALTTLVQGRTTVEASRVKHEDLVKAVGGLPQASEHASHLAMDALKEALKHIAR